MCTRKPIVNAKVSARQPCWSKTDFDVTFALKVILGHSFCNHLQALTGVAYRHVILMVLSLTFPKK